MLPEAHILIVEDSPGPLDITIRTLKLRGFTYEVAGTAEETFAKLKSGSFDLILLDLGLPDMDGLEVCKQLKADPSMADIPIIMLTGRGSPSDKIAGLEMGADDYLVKAFDPGELIARIHVALRRRKVVRTTPNYAGSGIRVDVKTRQVYVGTETVRLTNKEFDLLALLLKTPGKSVTRDEISHLIWNKPAEESSRSLETHIWSLRSKLGAAGKSIETADKVGYRFNS